VQNEPLLEIAFPLRGYFVPKNSKIPIFRGEEASPGDEAIGTMEASRLESGTVLVIDGQPFLPLFFRRRKTSLQQHGGPCSAANVLDPIFEFQCLDLDMAGPLAHSLTGSRQRVYFDARPAL